MPSNTFSGLRGSCPTRVPQRRGEPGCPASSLLWIKALEGLGESQAVYKLHNEQINCTQDDYPRLFLHHPLEKCEPRIHDQNGDYVKLVLNSYLKGKCIYILIYTRVYYMYYIYIHIISTRSLYIYILSLHIYI